MRSQVGGDGAELLVCVYYSVARADAPRVIQAVREFQRTLPAGVGACRAQVLLRCDLPSAAPSPDAPTTPSTSKPAPAASSRAGGRDADATVMETYQLALPAPAGHPVADRAARAFLDQLGAAASVLAGLLRSDRHVELFAPCAS